MDRDLVCSSRRDSSLRRDRHHRSCRYSNLVQHSRMKIKVSYLDILDVKNQEEAYDSLLKYCGEVVKSGDVSAFCFEEVEGNRLLEEGKD